MSLELTGVHGLLKQLKLFTLKFNINLYSNPSKFPKDNFLLSNVYKLKY